MHIVFLVAACVSILAVALICIFLFANGLPAIAKIGPTAFLTGMKWKPMNLRNCRCNYRRCADWNFVCSFYGKILPQETLSGSEAGH